MGGPAIFTDKVGMARGGKSEPETSAVSEGTAQPLCLRREAGETGGLSISGNALLCPWSYTVIRMWGPPQVYTHNAEPGALEFSLYAECNSELHEVPTKF